MLIPVSIESNKINIKEEINNLNFYDLNLTEAAIEEFVRLNIGRFFDNDMEISESLLIVGQQVVNLQGARNDLVAIDSDGNLVLIEIKRDASDIQNRSESLEFQSIRYAASLATINNIDDLIERIYSRYIEKHRSEFDLSNVSIEELARRNITNFLTQNNSKNNFNKKQRILLISSGYDQQTLSAVSWLSSNGVNISCISLNPIKHGDKILLNVDSLIPVRNNEDYLIPFKDKSLELSNSSSNSRINRRTLPRMNKLMEWGIIKPGMILHIKNYPEQTAEVIDSKTVLFKNEKISFNAWGSEVTGWSSICIYDFATTQSGETLSELRSQKMKELKDIEVIE
ncbi:PDDEXK family nuclease [Gluconobacter oxydans]|uniref:hypothetical protein n=1 Tax=Gluconobacter oxydans TaxID=442 RepID=UPI0009BCEEFE|nr:hypothetical protein [Gluconobacter oxydans]